MLGDRFSNTIQHPFQIIQFTCLLYLYKNDLILAITCFDVNAVVLVVYIILVAFALQDFDDMNRLIEKNGYQSFKNSKVGFVTQHALGSPVKTDIFVVVFHTLSFLANLRKKNENIGILRIFFLSTGNINHLTYQCKTMLFLAVGRE